MWIVDTDDQYVTLTEKNILTLLNHYSKVVVYAFNPITTEAEAGEFMRTWGQHDLHKIPQQQELHREILSQKQNQLKQHHQQQNTQSR